MSCKPHSPDHRSPPHPGLLPGNQTEPEFSNVADRIQNALRILAEIIADDGEQYLPIFERLERELNNHESQQATLARALALAEESSG